MKKLVAFLLCILLTISCINLVACSNGEHQHIFYGKTCEICAQNIDELTIGVYDMGATTSDNVKGYLLNRNDKNADDENYLDFYIIGEGNVINYTDYAPYLSEYGSRIKNLFISKKVTSIGDIAFYDCTSLTNVTFEKNSELKSIGVATFYWCTALTSIEIPNSVTSIGDSAFGGYYNKQMNLTNVTLSNSLGSIGANAFEYCSKLTSIEIPNNVISIGDNAFKDCYKLVEVINNSPHITIKKGSSSNGSVGDYALAVYNSDSGVTESQLTNDNGYIIYTEGEEKILVNYIGTEKDLMLPTYITKINDYAFYNYDSLTSVTIGNSVTSIGYSAFDINSISNNETFKNAIFENTSNWKAVYDISNAYIDFDNNWLTFAVIAPPLNLTPIQISSVDLADSEIAAEYLRDTYRLYDWYRE